MALLATGVVGVIEFLLTIPAVLYVDKFGRKSILLAGAIGMATCHFIVAGLIGSYKDSWPSHVAAGWVCIAVSNARTSVRRANNFVGHIPYFFQC